MTNNDYPSWQELAKQGHECQIKFLKTAPVVLEKMLINMGKVKHIEDPKERLREFMRLAIKDGEEAHDDRRKRRKD